MSDEGHRIKEAFIVEAIAEKLGTLKCDVERRITIKNFKVSDGSNRGDNFACVMKAVHVEAEIDGKIENFDFMTKCMPLNPIREKWITDAHIFEKEIIAYSKILPALKTLQVEAIDMGMPQYYFANENVMIMENLKTQGYKMVDKRQGLDLTHIKLLLNQFSMLHAVGHHWVQIYPGGLEQAKEDYPLFFHNEGWFQHGNAELKAQFDASMVKMFEGSAGIVQSCDKNRDKLGEKMIKFSKCMIEKLNDVAQAKPDQFCSILHGDCWNNNFMFLYDESGNLVHTKVVDYQLMRYGCVCLDLVYFFCSSTCPQMRKDHLNDLLHYYHSQLMTHLKYLGYPDTVYPFEKFQKEFDDCFVFGFITGTFIGQLILSEKAAEAGGTMDMDDCMTEEDRLKKMEGIDRKIIDEARGNVPLQERLVALAQEAAHRGII